jgi:soluble lytic murein transglycosylase-like protein
MGFLSEYGTARETERTLDDQALARQRQVVADTANAQARMEKLRQAEILRRMPTQEALPDTSQIQYGAAPTAAAPAGLASSAPGTMGAYKPRRTDVSAAAPAEGDGSNAIMVSEANRRLQSMRRSAAAPVQPPQTVASGGPPVDLKRLQALQRAGGATWAAGPMEAQLNPPPQTTATGPTRPQPNVRPTTSQITGEAARLKQLQGMEAAPTPAAPSAPIAAPAATVSPYDKPTAYDPIIQQAAQQAGIDPVMFKRLIGSESSFSPTATSPRGESFGYGIAQIAAVHGLSREQMANPAVALPFAAKLLAGYIQQAGGDAREGVLRYKGAVSEAGRAAMGQVYDSKIAGGAPQAVAPQMQAPATPISRAIASGGFTPEQLSNMAGQQGRMAQFKMQQIQQLAQVTSDPKQLAQYQDQYAQLDEFRREAHFANLYAQGELTDREYAQVSAQERARVQAAAAERQKVALKAEGEIAVEDARGANARVLEQQKAINEAAKIFGGTEGLKIVSPDDGKTIFVTRGNQVLRYVPGVMTPVGMSESSMVPVKMGS